MDAGCQGAAPVWLEIGLRVGPCMCDCEALGMQNNCQLLEIGSESTK